MITKSNGILAGGLAGIALLAAACGGGSATPAVASLGAIKTTTTTALTAANRQADALKFSACMRSNGVTNFPDPGSGGRIQFQDGQGGALDRNSPTFQAASKACSKYRPKPSPAQIQALQQNALKFSTCMRSHGVANFPDPNFSSSGGGFRVRIGSASGGLDPNSPTFQAAQKACAADLPGRGRFGTRIGASGGGPPPGAGSGSSAGAVAGG